jgi:hypothetical protein
MNNTTQTQSGASAESKGMDYKFINCRRNYPVWRGDGYRYDPIFKVTRETLGYWIRALQPVGIQRVIPSEDKVESVRIR